MSINNNNPLCFKIRLVVAIFNFKLFSTPTYGTSRKHLSGCSPRLGNDKPCGMMYGFRVVDVEERRLC